MNTVINDEEERIRQRAFELWEEAGRPEGKEYTHWIRARKEIAEEREREARSSDRTSSDSTSTRDIAQNVLPAGTVPENPTAEDGGNVIRSDRFGQKKDQPKKPLDERDIDTQLDDPGQ